MKFLIALTLVLTACTNPSTEPVTDFPVPTRIDCPCEEASANQGPIEVPFETLLKKYK